ncbi:uncharacterized protein LOC114331874 [Diabrotica virgifera virgifera]|uniref:Uncharacterized protein LOC114331874 isoform X1 n=1 Tax=Diabrotica virgifera virgifera TaxID=50390 RepID=A0A6P7FMN2_DIAVI|nr:uncharacterized protein LOC114331874 [Diabrotica virgifera virgifera]
MAIKTLLLVVILAADVINFSKGNKDTQLSGIIDIVDNILPTHNPCNCQKELDGIYDTLCEVYEDVTELNCEIDDIKKYMDKLEQKTCRQNSTLTSLKVEVNEVKKNQTKTVNLLKVQTTVLQGIIVNLKKIKEENTKIHNHVDKQTGSIQYLYQLVLNIVICLKK